MNIISIEYITIENLELLKKLSRKEKRESMVRFQNMTLSEIFKIDLSCIMNEPIHLSKCNIINIFPDTYDKYTYFKISELIELAEQASSPILIKFDSKLSKAFEEKLRLNAKKDGCKIRIFRLIGGYCGMEITRVIPKTFSFTQIDSDFLNNIGINA